jgi:hypothetical protein
LLCAASVIDHLAVDAAHQNKELNENGGKIQVVNTQS